MLPIHTVLYPTDLSEESAAAFQLAKAVARDYGARLVLLTVYPQPLTGSEEVDRDRPDGIDDVLFSKLRELKPDPATHAEYWVEEGRPAEVILAVAKKIHADLIVMGTHGRSGLRRAIMGSVAEDVNRKATCPVMTVRGELTSLFRAAGESVEPLQLTPIPESADTVVSGEAGNIADAEAGPEDWREVPGPAADPARDVVIPLGPHKLRGTLRWSGTPRGVVVFAHGSGSSRHSPRNQFVAGTLVEAGFATLLLDLMSESESEDRQKVFDIGLLADRLSGAAEWVASQPEMGGLPIGYFGASTGSAAALMAAASHPARVTAVVSRGGRPDLAWDDLKAVDAPTLLIVGGDDEPVLSWNRDAFEQLTCTKELTVVPGATHLFEEPGTLERVAELARDWFARYLNTGTKATAGKTVR